MKLSELYNKKILILGFAREGQDTFLFLQKQFPNQIIGVADKNPEIPSILKKQKQLVKLHLGERYLEALGEYDIIIKSPGIPLSIVTPLLTKGQKITSQTNLFFAECHGTIIGVTGTKGKSTTASLIYKVLQEGGVRVELIGNIGKPVLSYVEAQKPKDVFVYELSSFQLETTTKSPHIAVFLNLYPEHLDHHGSLALYKKAKANITKFQQATDFLIYNAEDSFVTSIAKKSKAKIIPFNYRPSKNNGLFLADPTPAIIVGKLFGIPAKQIQKNIKNFTPLPHRLEKVGEYNKITFINDSLATIPQATISALNIFKGKVETLIVGGFDRGVPYKKLSEKIAKAKIKTLILFPDTGKKILAEIKTPPSAFFAKNMQEAVKLAYQHTKKGKICLMSPASSSFNMFRDYQDRGDQFKLWVKKYGKK